MGWIIPHEDDNSYWDGRGHIEPYRQVIHTDQGPAFHNELVTELLRLGGIQQSFATAYSSEENGIVERANPEVLRHLRALLFDSRVHDKWSFEQVPFVQRIMNTLEKASTGVTPAELILSHSIPHPYSYW